MPLFFINKEDIQTDSARILGDDAFHIARSLRMAVGDGITVSDGAGTVYSCRLTKIRDDECECEILSEAPCSAESPVDITLFMGYPKGDKLETVIQKAVELGAKTIIPFESERCINRPKAEKIDKQLTRLNRIAEEAAKQCGRGVLPKVCAPIGFKEMLVAALGCELPIFCYEGAGTRSLKQILTEGKGARSICAVVGSEGGFSPEEAKTAIDRGLIPANLGPRILRCESAPMYVLSALSFFFEL